MLRYTATVMALSGALFCSAEDKPKTVVTEIVTRDVARIPAHPSADFHMVVSPDFKRLAMAEPYAKDRWYISVDNRVWEFYEQVDPASLQFSADSQHVACAAKWENWWFIVVDNHGRAAELPGMPTELRFLPGSEKTAYVAHQENAGVKTACAVVAGAAGPKYEDVRGLVISQDGKHAAYVAKDAGKNYVVLDDKKFEAAEVVSQLVFVKDKARWVEFEKGKEKSGVVLEENGTEVKRWELATEFRRASLSPDGELVAIVDVPDVNGKFERVSVEGVAVKSQYKKIDRMTWGPGNVLAFVGDLNVASPTMKETASPAQALVVGGAEDTRTPTEIVGQLIFSQDGKEVTYFARTSQSSDAKVGCFVRDVRRQSSVYWASPFGTNENSTIAAVGNYDVNGGPTVAATRTVETGNRQTLTVSPALISVNGKQMMEVKLTGIRESTR